MFSKLGGGGKPEEEKTVTAGTSVIEVLPSSGKTMKKVTVNPTPSQSKTVTPSTSQQTVSPDAGKLLSQVIVNAMASGALSDITVSSAGLITAQVGTSGYLASGTKKTKQLTTQAANTVTPSDSEQTAVASGRYTTGDVKVAAIPSKYLNLENMGFTKCAVDEFTFSSITDGSSASISHSLGETPKMVLILSYGNTFNTENDIMFAFWEGRYTYKTTSTYLCYYNAYYGMPSQSTCSIVVDANTVKLNTNSYYWGTGIKYKMITMA